MNLRGGRHGEAWVAAAGPLVQPRHGRHRGHPASAAVWLAGDADQVIEIWPLAVLANIAFYFVLINTSLFIFNLLPVPPLDGWRVLGGLVSPQMSWQMRNLERQYAQFIPLIFLVFIVFAGGKIIGPIADFLLNILLGPQYDLLPVIR